MLNLFDNVVLEEKLHPNFKRTRSDKYIVNVINKWCNDFIDRDGKFVIEFQTTFNSSFWELYCFAVFKEMSMKIDLSKSRPDFVLSYKKNNLNIECVVANNSQNDLPEHNIEEKMNPKSDLEDMVYNQTLRLLNAINSKNDLYLKSYCNLSHVEEKPFLIALAPFDQPRFMDVALEAIHMVLYGINVDKKSLKEIHFDTVYKRKDCPLDLGIFTNNKFENISAVLFSNVATSGKARAMSDCPNVTFNQMRYNENSTKPLVAVNYRLNAQNTLLNKSYKKMIKEYAEDFKGKIDHKRYSCRKPFLEEGYNENLTDGLHLYLNPYSKKPISEDVMELFASNGVQIHSYDIKEHTMKDVNVSDGYIIQRMVSVFK